MQLYTLNFKKQVKKEGPRTNLSSTPLTAVNYMRSGSLTLAWYSKVGPYSKEEVGVHGEAICLHL